MASSRLVYLLTIALTCSFQYVLCSNQVPVFMWGDLENHSAKANPLTKVSDSEFQSTLIEETLSEPFTVVFIEENLSVEDFSRKNADGKTTFPYLHANIADSLYLPIVESAVEALTNVVDADKVDKVKLTENGLSAEIEPEGGRYLFISLKDAREGESRTEMLRRHNDFMEDMFAKLKERYEKVVGVYTALYPSWTVPESHSRVRRQTIQLSNSTTYISDIVLIHVKDVTIKQGNNLVPLNGQGKLTSKFNESIRAVDAVLDFGDNLLRLYFTSVGGYWYLNQVDIEVTKDGVKDTDTVMNSEVFAVEGFSYKCSQHVSYAGINDTKGYVVSFEDLQIQPFFRENATIERLRFDDAYYCVGFTSVPIWAGLFVVFILLSIMFYGVMMMMDIRTMDRFDDPKGKSITVNAGE